LQWRLSYAEIEMRLAWKFFPSVAFLPCFHTGFETSILRLSSSGLAGAVFNLG
jgi:hypothetical protein